MYVYVYIFSDPFWKSFEMIVEYYSAIKEWTIGVHYMNNCIIIMQNKGNQTKIKEYILYISIYLKWWKMQTNQ